jgi:hypothetical protein
MCIFDVRYANNTEILLTSDAEQTRNGAQHGLNIAARGYVRSLAPIDFAISLQIAYFESYLLKA